MVGEQHGLQFVSCGVRVSDPTVQDFEILFNDGKSCTNVQHAPSKALVFSEINQEKRDCMNYLRCMRALSPFDDLVLTNTTALCTWVELWVARLVSENDTSDNDKDARAPPATRPSR